MSIHFTSIQLANLIISNSTCWYYDNCKVPISCLETLPLASIIEAYLPLDQKRVLGAWDLAVYHAHGAATDYHRTDLAIKNSLAYCIQIFRKNLSALKQLEEAKLQISSQVGVKPD